MGDTIDLVADDPADAPAFGGTTRVLSEHELSGLLAEDARAAPGTVAHPKTVRRSTLSEAASAVPEQIDEPDPWQPPAASSLQVTPPPQPARRGHMLWLIVALLAAAAAAWLFFESGLR